MLAGRVLAVSVSAVSVTAAVIVACAGFGIGFCAKANADADANANADAVLLGLLRRCACLTCWEKKRLVKMMSSLLPPVAAWGSPATLGQIGKGSRLSYPEAMCGLLNGKAQSIQYCRE